MEVGKNRILLVEEDAVQRMLLREYLESVTRYEVVEPEGVFHLLAHSESERLCPTLILLDMEWSRVDTVSLILEIWKRNPAIPILGMTDRQTEIYDDKRLRGHSIGLIRKPFSPNLLHRSITATLKAQTLKALRKNRAPLSRVYPNPQAARILHKAPAL